MMTIFLLNVDVRAYTHTTYMYIFVIGVLIKSYIKSIHIINKQSNFTKYYNDKVRQEQLQRT